MKFLFTFLIVAATLLVASSDHDSSGLKADGLEGDSQGEFIDDFGQGDELEFSGFDNEEGDDPIGADRFLVTCNTQCVSTKVAKRITCTTRCENKNPKPTTRAQIEKRSAACAGTCESRAEDAQTKCVGTCLRKRKKRVGQNQRARQKKQRARQSARNPTCSTKCLKNKRDKRNKCTTRCKNKSPQPRNRMQIDKRSAACASRCESRAEDSFILCVRDCRATQTPPPGRNRNKVPVPKALPWKPTGPFRPRSFKVGDGSCYDDDNKNRLSTCLNSNARITTVAECEAAALAFKPAAKIVGFEIVENASPWKFCKLVLGGFEFKAGLRNACNANGFKTEDFRAGATKITSIDNRSATSMKLYDCWKLRKN